MLDEEELVPSGYRGAGVDEAGRGPLAGPVTAACVVLPLGYSHLQITDSKKLTEKSRELLYPEIVSAALAWSVVSVGQHRVDRFNIREATRIAMAHAARRVKQQIQEPLHFLVDGNMTMRNNFPQTAIVKGDSKVLSIAAASIIAKVTRDRLMKRLDETYPGYGLAGHKGYPTKKHRELIKELGPSPIHRKTFGGVREFVSPLPGERLTRERL